MLGELNYVIKVTLKMAQNSDLHAVMPKLLAMGLQALYDGTLAANVTRRCESTPGREGSTIEVSVSPKVPTALVQLNIRREAEFFLTDEEMMGVHEDIFPEPASNAISALAQDINMYILGLYRGSGGALPFTALGTGPTTYSGSTGTGKVGNFSPVYLAIGTAGTTPFESIQDVEMVSRLLTNAERSERDIVMAVNRSALSSNAHDALARAVEQGWRSLRKAQNDWEQAIEREQYGLRNTQNERMQEFNLQKLQKINRLLTNYTFVMPERRNERGVRFWWYFHNVLRHTTIGTGTVTVNKVGGLEVGDTSTPWDGGGTMPVAGDLFTFAGGSERYAVASATTTNITFAPALTRAVADKSKLDFVASHTVNLAWEPEGIAFVSRPPMDAFTEYNRESRKLSRVDEMSEIVLRLKVVQQYWRTKWSFDILFGGTILQPELICRVMGE